MSAPHYSTKMKPSICLVSVFSLVFILSCPISLALDQTLSNIRTNDFLHCLIKNSLPSQPITKAIYSPNYNNSFSSVFRSYVRNLRFISNTNQTMPSLIVTAMHESHVQATIVCCKAHNVMLRKRSGGHDMEGVSYVSRAHVPFVLLDMFNLRGISIDLDYETMWVQTGATLGEVYYNIATKSKTHAFPAGLCPTVGVGGHFSGGGFGTLVRKYGLATENILDAKIVDVNGKILDRKAMGEDLFWAINGGGGASFGVILSFKLKLVKVPEKVTVMNVYRTTEHGTTQLIRKWQDVAVSITKDLFLRLELHAMKPNINATFVGLYLGRVDDLIKLTSKKFPELGLKRDDCTEMSWIQSVLYFYAFPIETPPEILLNRTQNDRSYVKSKSDFVKEPISKKKLESIWEKMIMLAEEGEVLMQWNPLGGRMSEIPATQTPTPQRSGYLFKIQYLVYWHEKDKDTKYLDLSRKFYDLMAPYVTKSPRETFLNYRDLDIGNSPYCNATYEEAKVYNIKYFNKNFERLVRVKTTVDPNNFFRDEQSIPVLPTK